MILFQNMTSTLNQRDWTRRNEATTSSYIPEAGTEAGVGPANGSPPRSPNRSMVVDRCGACAGGATGLACCTADACTGGGGAVTVRGAFIQQWKL